MYKRSPAGVHGSRRAFVSILSFLTETAAPEQGRLFKKREAFEAYAVYRSKRDRSS